MQLWESARSVPSATILLPFTVLDSFAGVFSRPVATGPDPDGQQRLSRDPGPSHSLVVVREDLGSLFYLLVLAVLSLNRFLLAGSFASLSNVGGRNLLVTTNGISPPSRTARTGRTCRSTLVRLSAACHVSAFEWHTRPVRHVAIPRFRCSERYLDVKRSVRRGTCPPGTHTFDI